MRICLIKTYRTTLLLMKNNEGAVCTFGWMMILLFGKLYEAVLAGLHPVGFYMAYTFDESLR